MRKLFAILLLLSGQGLFANMASPVRPGTYSSSAISSRNIDILSETISILPANDFKTAAFSIEYHIRADSSGKQIPLLFHALDYKGDFRVMLDEQEVLLQALPDDYSTSAPGLTGTFPFINENTNSDGPKLIYWDKDFRNVLLSGDLKYFEVDLSKGEHRIRVYYTANVWTDRSGWVRNYSFRYSLSPARFWRSFGTLDVQLDTSQFSSALQTNLGTPASREGSRIHWHFSQLPGDYIGISHTPELKPIAKLLVTIGPEWLSLCLALIIVLLHYYFIRKFRERRPEATISWVLILGSIAVPFLALGSLPFAYDLIDSTIGPEAGRYHGYNFLVIVLYPFLLPVYGLLMWFIDRRFKRQLSAKTPDIR